MSETANKLPGRLLVANRGEIAVRDRADRPRDGDRAGRQCYAAADAGAFHMRAWRAPSRSGAGRRSETLSLDPAAPRAPPGKPARTPCTRATDSFPRIPRSRAPCRDAGLIWVGRPPPPWRRWATSSPRAADARRGRARRPGLGRPAADAKRQLVAEASRIGYPAPRQGRARAAAARECRASTRRRGSPAALEEARRLAERRVRRRHACISRSSSSAPATSSSRSSATGTATSCTSSSASAASSGGTRRSSRRRRAARSIRALRDAMGRGRRGGGARRRVRRTPGPSSSSSTSGRNFYFLEMNTRLQVEHPITEETLGLDLVRAQIEVAAGRRPAAGLARTGRLQPQGHAIELRLYAEDPGDFSAAHRAECSSWSEPAGPGVRVDAGVEEGSRVGLEYDPLLAKLVVSGPDRGAAIARARRALAEWIVLGVETNRQLLSAVLDVAGVRLGRLRDGPRRSAAPRQRSEDPPDAAWIAAALALRSRAGSAGSAFRPASRAAADPGTRRRAGGRAHEARGSLAATTRRRCASRPGEARSDGRRVTLEARDARDGRLEASDRARTLVPGPRGAGRRARLRLVRGDRVGSFDGAGRRAARVGGRAGGLVARRCRAACAGSSRGRRDASRGATSSLILEAMKMEHAIRAPRDGRW